MGLNSEMNIQLFRIVNYAVSEAMLFFIDIAEECSSATDARLQSRLCLIIASDLHAFDIYQKYSAVFKCKL